MFFLKHATESSFLISIGVLFHSLVAETAKECPPSVSLLLVSETQKMIHCEHVMFQRVMSLLCPGLKKLRTQYIRNFPRDIGARNG